MSNEQNEIARRGLTGSLAAVSLLIIGIGVGSRNLIDYDPALLMYTFGSLISLFVVTFRVIIFLHRPPTRLYFVRSLELLFNRRFLPNLWLVTRAFAVNFVMQRFILRRNRLRWSAHILLSWGSILAAAVTFPLVFGWVHFETPPTAPSTYQLFAFGFRITEFSLATLKSWLVFNLLNISAVLVIVGTVMALHRRLYAPGRSRARQQFGNDLIPLILLLMVSVTGLMLTYSTHAMGGQGYSELSLIHALVVMVTLIYLPFGKLFHLFVRPLHLGIELYRAADAKLPPARCRSCGEAYAGSRHVEDMKTVLGEVGLEWELEQQEFHYAEICPACRRRLFGISQAHAIRRSA